MRVEVTGGKERSETINKTHSDMEESIPFSSCRVVHQRRFLELHHCCGCAFVVHKMAEQVVTQLQIVPPCHWNQPPPVCDRLDQDLLVIAMWCVQP